MQNIVSPNVRTGKLPLRTFGVYGIILLVAVGATWWFTKKFYDKDNLMDRTFMQLDSTLERSITTLKENSREEVWKMEDKMKNIAFRTMFVVWKPKMDSAMLIAIRVENLFESYRNRLLDTQNIDKTTFPVRENLLKKITDSLNTYKRLLYSLLPSKEEQYLKNLALEKYLTVSMSDELFSNLTGAGQLAVLNAIKFNALKATNNTLYTINSQHSFSNESYDQFDVLISQNTTYLFPGQTLEISAGLGVYASYAKPKIVIDGKEQALNYYGTAIYKKVFTSNGSGFIPISVSYKDPMTGNTFTKVTSIPYTVFQQPKK